MKKKNKLSSYSFWISLFGIVFLIAQQILKHLNINMDANLFLDISSAICLVLIGLGVITGTKNMSIKKIKEDITNEKDSNQDEENQEK